MGFFNSNKKQEQPIAAKPHNNFQVNSVNLGVTQVPKATESASYDWVLNGQNNSFPKELIEMIDQSPTQSAILQAASLMTAGNGILLAKTKEESDAIWNTLDPVTYSKLKEFIKNANPNNGLEAEIFRFIQDYKTFGYAFLEVVYNKDYSRPIQINYLDVFKMAIGKREIVTVNGMDELMITHFWYSEDWEKKNTYTPVRINAFNPSMAKKNKDARQVIYIRRETNGMDYYGKPSYVSALKAIKSDGLISSTNLNSLENGFSPNVLIRFYNEPTPEEQQKVEWGFKNTMKGIGQKLLFLYWGDKETAPDVQPINVENFDEKLITINDLNVSQIVAANRIDPTILGIKTPGKLGDSNELATAYSTYYNTVLLPERRIFEKILTTLFKLNGFDNEIFFEDINTNFESEKNNNNQTTLKIIN